MRELFLTFDIEDTISKNSIASLRTTLIKLEKYDLKGLFFITGHMAEKLVELPDIVNMLSEHEIGYHSSSHSVNPSIFKFTDVVSYEEAFECSLQRETSHINPLTGEIEGPGGIKALSAIFPNKEINIFRAPGYCWHPAHLEALKRLGIQFDFSADISSRPVKFKGLIFYPFPILPSNWLGTGYHYRLLMRKILTHKTTVLTIHPSDYVNETFWDSIYREANPNALTQPKPMDSQKSRALFDRFDSLLKRLKLLSATGALEVTPLLNRNQRDLIPTKLTVERCYHKSMDWATYRSYKPSHIEEHFFSFFLV